METLRSLAWEFVAITVMVLVVVALGKLFAYILKRKMGE